jgi:hypothetical protein
VDERVLGYPLSPKVAEKPAAAPKEIAAVPAAPPAAILPVLIPPAKTEKGPAPTQKAPVLSGGESWRSQPFPFYVKGMAAGDVNGDGRNEVVLIEQKNLSIYRYENEFKLLKKIEGNKLDNYLAVDVGDIRKDGKPQIFVTNLQGDRLSSFVVAFQDGNYRVVAKDLDWFLRVVDWGDKGKVLLGQRKGKEAGWQGPIYELGWDGKSYKEMRKADLPKGPTIYGFTPFMHEGKMAFIFIDSDFKMKAVNQKGKVIWRSKETYGSDNGIRVKEPDAFRAESGDEYVWVNVRVIAQGDEILVIRNKGGTGEFFKRQRFYSGGDVQRLVWNGAMLMESWRSQEIPGYLVDFQVQNILGEQGKELVLAVNLPKESVLSFEKSSALMVSRLQGIQ